MAEKRRSPCALSVKAHAFSVESLIGAEKRRRTAGEGATSPGYDVPKANASPELQPAARTYGSEAEYASDGSRE